MDTEPTCVLVKMLDNNTLYGKELINFHTDH